MLFSGCNEKDGQRQRFWRFYNGLQTQASLNGWSPDHADMVLRWKRTQCSTPSGLIQRRQFPWGQPEVVPEAFSQTCRSVDIIRRAPRPISLPLILTRR
jgi:hypothetical protein